MLRKTVCVAALAPATVLAGCEDKPASIESLGASDSIAQPLAAGVGPTFMQTLRHSGSFQKQTQVCELSLLEPPPGTFIMFTELVDGHPRAAKTATWQGLAIPPENPDLEFGKPKDRVEVTACEGTPCRVTARMTTKGNAPGVRWGCEINAAGPLGEPLAQGVATGTVLTAEAVLPGEEAVFRQKLLQNVARTRMGSQCTLRYISPSARATPAQSLCHSLFRNGQQLATTGPLEISLPDWSTLLDEVGTVDFLGGGDPSSVRIKSVVPRGSTLAPADVVFCTDALQNDASGELFHVNDGIAPVSTTGMSLTQGPGCVAEVCDGRDNDCDGNVDGMVLVPGTWGDCEGFADICDETGTRTRTNQVCLAGMPTAQTEEEDCARETDGLGCDDGDCWTRHDECVGGACVGSDTPVGAAFATQDLATDPYGRAVHVCFADDLALTEPWDRFRFDIDLVQPTARDAGAFLGDLNGDGIPDLVMAGFLGRAVVFPGIPGEPTLFGEGQYIRNALASASDDPYRFDDFAALWVTGDMADLDGDGVAEVILGDTIYRNVSTASEPALEELEDLHAAVDPAPSVGDLNADGLPDVVVSGYSLSTPARVDVFWNTSTPGSFSFERENLVSSLSWGEVYALGDVNGDGLLDLGGGEGILFNSGTADQPAFDIASLVDWDKSGGPSWPSTSDMPTHVFLSDADGDGLIDAYVSTLASTVWQALFFKNVGTATDHHLEYQGPVVVRSTPTNVARARYTTPSFSHSRAFGVAADMDGNGLTDILFTGAAIGWQFPTELSPGDYAFAYPDLYTLPEHPLVTFECGGAPDALCAPPRILTAWTDLTGDGLEDAVRMHTSDPYALYASTRTGTMPFELAPEVPLATASGDQASGLGATWIDVDLDGRVDLVAGSYQGELIYYRNVGAGEEVALAGGIPLMDTTSTAIDVGYESWPTAIDLDGDGDLDLLVGDDSGSIHEVLCVAAGSSGGYEVAGLLGTDQQDPLNLCHTIGGSYQTPALAAADVDHDGLQDVVMGSDDGRVWLLHNTGTETEAEFSLEVLSVSRTTAANLQLVAANELRVYFGPPILGGRTSLGFHGLPLGGGGTLSGSVGIELPSGSSGNSLSLSAPPDPDPSRIVRVRRPPEGKARPAPSIEPGSPGE